MTTSSVHTRLVVKLDFNLPEISIEMVSEPYMFVNTNKLDSPNACCSLGLNSD